MTAFIKTFLALFGKSGLRAIINGLAETQFFQDAVQGLIMARLKGLKEKQPELYATINGYAIVTSKLPAILTDDEDDAKQIAALLELKGTFEGASDASAKVVGVFTENKSLKLKLKI
jgi:hypothetical protein